MNTSSLFVQEAKRRGLDCGIRDRNVSSSGKSISNKNIKNKTNSLKDNYSRNNKKNNLSKLPNCSVKSEINICVLEKNYKKI